MTGITATTPAGAVTTTADTYPAAGAAQPHGISTQKVTTSSGSTTTSYGYDPVGHLTTLTSTAQNEALTWNDEGQLAQVAITPSGGSAKDISYIYDASSTLLLTTDPSSKTLYLGDEEITENTGTSAVTGTRYYSLGSTTVAARTGASTLAYLAGDQQDTSSVAISSTSLAVTHRYYDAYGNTRGTAQPAWPEAEKGFIGGADDTATGLTDLGVREYQPGTGSFISPDPLLTPYDPQDLNAYAYAADNPATNSDPSGAMMITDGGGGSGPVDCTSAAAQQVAQCAQPKPKGTNSDSGCPPTELSCTPPLPLTKAGRESYQKPGWVKPKPLPVKKENTNGKANKTNTSCGAEVRLTGQCSSGSGSGVWNFITNHLRIAATIGSILAAGLGSLSLITTAGTGNVLVYISVDLSGNVIYVGITKNIVRRAAEQFNAKGIVISAINGLNNLSRSDARAVEQVLIEEYNGPKGGRLINKINSISPKSPNYSAAIKRGCELLALAGYLAPKVC